jgi:hypothetical protein
LVIEECIDSIMPSVMDLGGEENREQRRENSNQEERDRVIKEEGNQVIRDQVIREEGEKRTERREQKSGRKG